VERGDLTASSADAAEGEVLQAVESALLRSAALARASDAELKTWDGRQFFTNYLEFGSQMNGLIPDLQQAMAALANFRGRPVDAVGLDISLVVIEKRPLRFAARVLGNFVRFLVLAEIPGTAGREEAEAMSRHLGQDWPGPAFWGGFDRMAKVAKSYRLSAWVLRAAHAAALVGIALAIGFSAWAAVRRRLIALEVGLGLVVAAGLLTYLLFCAFAINVQTRYVLTVWPLIVLSAVLALLIPARYLFAPPSTPRL
jgi:hypothetical protein